MAKDEDNYVEDEDGPTEITLEDPSEENYDENMTNDGFNTEAISQVSDESEEEAEAESSSKNNKKSTNIIVYGGIGALALLGVSFMGFIFLGGSNNTSPANNPNPTPIASQQQQNKDFSPQTDSDFGNRSSNQNQNMGMNKTSQSNQSSDGYGGQQDFNTNKPFASNNQNSENSNNENITFPDMEEDMLNQNQSEKKEADQENNIRTAKDFQSRLDNLNKEKANEIERPAVNNNTDDVIDFEKNVQAQNANNTSKTNNKQNNVSSSKAPDSLASSDNERLDLIDASAFRELKEKVGSIEKKFDSFQKYFKKEMNEVIRRLDNDDKNIDKLEGYHKSSSHSSNSSSHKSKKRPASSSYGSSNSGNVVQVLRKEPKYKSFTSSNSSKSSNDNSEKSWNKTSSSKNKSVAHYNIQAIISGRVWLKTSGSSAMSYTVGDLLDSNRRISAIDAKAAKVVLNDGTVIE